MSIFNLSLSSTSKSFIRIGHYLPLVHPAADAEALYPSLDPNICARVVREETLKSNLEVDGNWQEMARYLAMTSNPWEHKQ